MSDWLSGPALTLTIHGSAGWVALSMWATAAVAVPFWAYRIGKERGRDDAEERS